MLQVVKPKGKPRKPVPATDSAQMENPHHRQRPEGEAGAGEYVPTHDKGNTRHQMHRIRPYKYTLLNSEALVILRHIGHNLVAPKHLSQHDAQQVCQQPVETVASTYGDRQIRHVGAGG